MQKLEVHTGGGYVNYLKYLWEITSQDVFPSEVEVPNEGWIDLINTIWNGCHFAAPKININPFLIEEYITDGTVYTTDVVVGYSGGKDSLAVALTLQEYGYTPILMHIQGLTRSTSSIELKSTKEVAEKTGWPLEINKLSYKGDNPYIESPVRNFLVLAYMIEYMLEKNINKAAMGIETTDKTRYVPIEEHKNNGFSDGIDTVQLFVKAIRYTFKDFVLLDSIESKPAMTVWLYKKYKDLFDISSSCFCTDRFLLSKRQKYMKRYNLKYLPKYNCFCCRKCAQDYLILKEAGIKDWDQADGKEAEAYAKKVIQNALESRGAEVTGDPVEYIFEGYKKEIKQSNSQDWRPRLFRIEPETLLYLKGTDQKLVS
jgi:7-cyano-7-deazaguanine synthase in queuosine biosynthesis